MKPLEISFLAAGAVISLIAGGGAARLALIPLDDACAKGQAVADGFAPTGSLVAISAPGAAPAAAYPDDAPPPAAYASNETPTDPRIPSTLATARADRGAWRAPDRQDGSPYGDQDAPGVGAADYSGYAAAGPRFVEIGDRQDAGPYPVDNYAAENPAAYSRISGDGGAGPSDRGPSEPY